MTDKELRRLRRSELLEMLLDLSKENKELRKKLDMANAMLANRKIAIEESGSLAEAALKLNGIFEAAQRAADQYVENIQSMAKAQYLKDIQNKSTKAEPILEDAE